MIKALISMIWIGALGWGAYTLGKKQLSFRRYADQIEFLKPPLIELDPRFFKIMSLGYKPILDDYLYLALLQLILSDEFQKENPHRLAEISQLALRHEPPIESLYFVSCVVHFKYLGYPDRCRQMNDTAIKFFPKSLKTPMLQGYVSLFELNQPAVAALYYAQAATRPNAPPHIQPLVKRMLERAGPLSTGELQNLLQEVAKENQDPLWQKILVDKYRELQGAQQP